MHANYKDEDGVTQLCAAAGTYSVDNPCRDCPEDAKLDAMYEDEDGKAKQLCTTHARAAGTHVVLPGYYCPNNIGLLDYNTSDGRFLFFLPWQKHTLVGTTDTKSDAKTLPEPPEDEVQWLLNECSKYLSRDLRVRRSDVLSAWQAVADGSGAKGFELPSLHCKLGRLQQLTCLRRHPRPRLRADDGMPRCSGDGCCELGEYLSLTECL